MAAAVWSLVAVLAWAGTPKSSAAPLRVQPATLVLPSVRAERQLLLELQGSAGWGDATHAATWSSSHPGIARVTAGRVEAVSPGKAVVTVRAAGGTLRVPVTVVAPNPEPVDFQREVVPLLTKQGCSGGSCHGSPHGRGGLSLSLYGYDPRIDRESLTRDGLVRRINLLQPDESLLLKKPLLRLSHGGGKRLLAGENPHRLIREWIRQGARAPLTDLAVQSLRVTPGPSRVLRPGSLFQQLCVLATFADGTERDVTRLATYSSSHPAVVEVDADGKVAGLARGQAAISVRFLERLESVRFTVEIPLPGFVWKPAPEFGEIDRRVNRKLRQLSVQPAATADDATFFRRVHLDLAGLLPGAGAAKEWLADRSPEKRARLVDTLLKSEAHARFWASRRADLLRVNPRRLKDGLTEVFANHLVEAYRSNQPYNRLVRELLTASGDARQAAPSAYFIATPTLEERTETTAQLFMGSRLECARCHNHPFENWTMRDYYSIAAVFGRVQVDKTVVREADRGEVRLPNSTQVMRPWGSEPGQAMVPPREAFAAWLTGPDNPYFARVEANRIWADLFGRGIVDPIDDFRSSNPPSNAELLDYLAERLVASGYDRRALIREICASQTYQRRSDPEPGNRDDESLFSHQRVRLLSAEQIQDAVRAVSGEIGAFDPAQPADRVNQQVAWMTQRPYPERGTFSSAFGQPQRETACTCERTSEPTLLQALELLNGGIVTRSAAAAGAALEGLDNADLLDQLYLRALSRLPTEKERTTALGFLNRAPNRRQGVTDLAWTLLNTQEFLFQH